MTIPQYISQYFIFILGIILILISIPELIIPTKMFHAWKKIINTPLVRIYGLIIMISGIILTTFKGSLSTIIFIIGIILAILGPLSILYPEILRKVLSKNVASLDQKEKQKIIRSEGIMHLILGNLFIYVTYRFILMF